jgi:tetratricopeptide (TPR) repeat protein
MLCLRPLLILLLLSTPLAALGATATTGATLSGDDIDRETTVEELRRKGLTLVFGRLVGRFEGPEYRSRKLRFRHRISGEEHVVPVEPALGYFETALPAGTYHFVSVEAVYFPSARPMKPSRYPPVQQRYAIQPLPNSGLPFFPVTTDAPVYLGTIRSNAYADGAVYEGHQLRVVDDYDDAVEHLAFAHPRLHKSLEAASARPQRYFFVQPHEPVDPLELVTPNEPLERAREYIRERKFRQATDWLATLMPASDAERLEMRMLAGEALLGDKKYSEAVEELGEVLLADAGDQRALRLLARAHAHLGDDEDAFELYGALAESEPNDAEAQLHIGYHHALRGDAAAAESAFEASFRSNFDYLLHDLTPYALAIRNGDAVYEPPEVIDGVVKPPSTLRSRRDSRGAFAMLVDHKGKLLAVHVSRDAGNWASPLMMSMIRARFRAAKLNGVAIPCLVIFGADNVIETVK